MDTEPTGNMAGLADFIRQHLRQPIVVDLDKARETCMGALLVPDGYKVENVKEILDDYRIRPERREGTTELRTLESFIAWTKRHYDMQSVIYADDRDSKPVLTAIIDHDEGGPEIDGNERARYGRHRGVFAFVKSREWQAWMAISGKPLNVGDFAAFFEERIIDVVPPPISVLGNGEEVSGIKDPEILKLVATLDKKLAAPADISRLMRGIEINVDAKAKTMIDRDTGEHQIEFSEANGAGVERVKPPSLFLISIPVTHDGKPFLMAVHLRYRVVGGQVMWTMAVHQPERVFETVFADACAKVAEGTGLPPLRGIAPAMR